MLAEESSRIVDRTYHSRELKIKQKTKIYAVIGTRAQLIKMAPLMALMQKEGVEYEFIYTAQHRETITKLIKDFQIKEPDRTIYSKSEANTLTKFLGWGASMVLKLLRPKTIFPEKGIVLTHGDTVTTAWAAIVGKLAGCKVAHVESGLKTHNLFDPFPEELMRTITFYFSDIYFCQSQYYIDNLKKHKGEKINTGINTVYDSLVTAINSNVQLDLPKDPYVVVSIHRFENIYTKKLEEIIIPLLEKVAECGITLIFVLHPSTREVLKRNDQRLYKRLANNKRIILKERYSYFEFLKLLNESEFVITDGGSNQEELSYLGKPTLLFKKAISRIEGINQNAVRSHFDQNITMDFVKNYKKYQRSFLKVQVSPCKIIVDYLKNQM